MEPNESQTPYVFASYAYADRAKVEHIITRIESDGIRVWFEARDILAGWVFQNSITEAIGECTAFLTFISGKSQVSKNCRNELEYAVRMGKRIIPIFLEDAELSHGMKFYLNGCQWLRYSEGEHFWIRLLENLRECRVGQTDFAESKQRREIYRSLFEAQTKNEAVPLNEIKVVFLGDGEAGKTYTIARLLNDGGSPVGYTDQATPGIVIRNKDYTVEDRQIKVHYWDFGGQEILHSMHRIFLTERTLYMVLVNARDETQDARARYWLHNIQSFAPNAPVILVMNKMDQNPNAALNERDLRSKYPCLKRIIKISALKDSRGRLNLELRDGMLQEIMSSGITEMQWRAPWIRVKNALEKMKTDFIDGREYRRICTECGLGNDVKEQKELLHWFNDLGISFCYCDDYKLENYVILRPDWITNAIYIILFNSCPGARNGLLPHRGICKLLDPSEEDRPSIRSVLPDVSYKYDEVMYVLNVVRKFQLSFPGRDDWEFIPMLCQKDTLPVAEEYARDPNVLEFQMEFEYLPNNVLHRLMVERQRELSLENTWLTGALFEQKDTGLSAVVTIDDDLLRIYVRSTDPMHRPNTYLSMFKGNLDRIWRQMNLQEPKNRLVYKLDGRQEIFDYEMLTTMQQVGQTHAFSMTWKGMLPIWDILNQSAPAAADDSRKLLHSIVTACRQIQANRDCWELDENGRNTLVRNALRLSGYVIHDQTLQGISAGGKGAGELDMDIRRYENTPWTICEALRIRDGSKADWNGHLEKLLDNYNPHGAAFLYLLTYVDCAKDKFGSIFGGYECHIQTHGTGKFAVDGESYVHFAGGQWEENHYIQAAKVSYSCGGYKPTVYHIFVHMGR